MKETKFWEQLKSGHFAQMVRENTKGREISSPVEAYNIVKPLFAENDDVETMYCIFLDGQNHILAIEKMFCRVDQLLPMLQVKVCVLCFRLVSRRCHIISTIHQLSLTPLRTVLALFTHTAPHIVNSQKIRTY